MAHHHDVPVFGVLVLAGPLLLLATAVVSLCRQGVLGWVAAGALLAAVGAACVGTVRLVLRWWAGTKVAPRPQVRPADLRRMPRV